MFIIILVIIVIVRLGYACICNGILDNYHTVYYSNYDNYKLDEAICKNFITLNNILSYNKKNNVHFYRLTSNFIPLSTIVDFVNLYKDKFEYTSKLINGRFDMHVSEYCVLNSINKDVVLKSIDEINYHYKLLKAFNVKPSIVIHVGSNAFGKKNSISRFINNFKKLDIDVQNSLIIENDDKIFNVEDVLYLCKKIKRPMVLDVHHHYCNKSKNDLDFYLNDIFDTWDDIPKVHFSSSKNKKEFRSHSEYVNCDDFINFINMCDRDIDVMVEAKGKDDALFRLVREIKYKTDFIFLDDTTFKKDL